MKYREKTLIADYLSERVIDFLETENPLSLMPGMRTDLENKHKNRIDIICPVPLHPTKKRERGYNQAALIADKLAGHFGWQYEPDLVTRTKFTLSQARLSPEQRKLNVNRAFSIDRKITIQDANILVIDDVFTTGATVNSLSRILREQGVKSIYVLTVARA
jgi:ComF family protein